MAGGRPTKWSKKVQARICKAIRTQMSLEDAARYGGICYDTLNEWRKQGQADIEADLTTEFSEFSEALDAALLDAELQMAQVVTQAARGGKKVIQTKTVTKKKLLPLPPPPPDQGDEPEDVDAFFEQVVEEEAAEKQEPQIGVLVVVEEVTTRVEATLRPDWRAAAFVLERRHRDRWGSQATPETPPEALDEALLAALEQVYGDNSTPDAEAAASESGEAGRAAGA